MCGYLPAVLRTALQAGSTVVIMFYYTYVLRCLLESGETNFYIGYTPDLRTRLSDHKSKKVTSTKKYKSVALVYYEACKSKVDALLREKSLKTVYGRAFLKNRLKSDESRD